MQRIIFFKLADESFRTPKLFASLLAAFALLLFFVSVTQAFESWDNLKAVNSCLSGIENYQSNPEEFTLCQKMADDSFGFNIRLDQVKKNFTVPSFISISAKDWYLTKKQIMIALLQPIAWMLFWAAILILSLGIYRAGKIVIPIKQAIQELPKEHHIKHKK